MPKPDAPSQVEPREEPCVWEQRDPEDREILMDPDTGDSSRQEPQVQGGAGEEPGRPGPGAPDSAAPGQLSPRWKVPGLWSWLCPGGLSSGPLLSGVGLPRAQLSLSRVLCLIIQTLPFFRKVP